MTVYKIIVSGSGKTIERVANRSKVHPLSSCDWITIPETIRNGLKLCARLGAMAIKDTTTNEFILSLKTEPPEYIVDFVEIHCYKDFIYNRLFIELL